MNPIRSRAGPVCSNEGVCTVVLSTEPGRPLLIAGVRDELADRAWEPPAGHWPELPGLIGGRDLQAGGTWLAVNPDRRRVSCVLNGTGEAAPPASRRSRGVLPLRAAAGQPLDRQALGDLDPFRLVTAEPGRAVLQSWDGRDLAERELAHGLHLIVNSGLASDLDLSGAARSSAAGGREHERSRIAHFLKRFADAPRPDPHPGHTVAQAWGAWLPLADGGGLDPHDPRALIVRRELDDGRIWGTTSVSLVALSPGLVRYDFTAEPGDPAAWYQVR